MDYALSLNKSRKESNSVLGIQEKRRERERKRNPKPYYGCNLPPRIEGKHRFPPQTHAYPHSVIPTTPTLMAVSHGGSRI